MVYLVQVTVSGFVFFISPQEFVAESSIQDHYVMNGKKKYIYIFLEKHLKLLGICEFL